MNQMKTRREMLLGSVGLAATVVGGTLLSVDLVNAEQVVGPDTMLHRRVWRLDRDKDKMVQCRMAELEVGDIVLMESLPWDDDVENSSNKSGYFFDHYHKVIKDPRFIESAKSWGTRLIEHEPYTVPYGCNSSK